MTSFRGTSTTAASTPATRSRRTRWSASTTTGRPGSTTCGDDGFAGAHDAGLFAVDPDVAAYTDGVWPTPEFPAALDLGHIAPIDGPPWTDASSAGHRPPDADPVPTDVPDVSELAAYAGLDPTSAGAGWDALLGSERPRDVGTGPVLGPAHAVGAWAVSAEDVGVVRGVDGDVLAA